MSDEYKETIGGWLRKSVPCSEGCLHALSVIWEAEELVSSLSATSSLVVMTVLGEVVVKVLCTEEDYPILL